MRNLHINRSQPTVRLTKGSHVKYSSVYYWTIRAS
jgi:hypothetical protein